MKGKSKKRIPEIAISEFAEVFPASPKARGDTWVGSLAGSVDFVGDFVSPVIDIQAIETLQD